ncbi:hypothetical protein L1049_027514 [Liquidambar formosana]|uniref:Endonuclease/exonuclease/phosphatase domain-containing protein n=1 Tax=Liquidambar formosana TaxID=63359 RepID=A0AAP0WSK4_LIQFO
MGCDTWSWFCARALLTSTTTRSSSFKRRLLLCKPTITCCITGPTDSSSSSSRICYDSPPELIRHWVKGDPPLASQERFTAVSYNILGDKNASKHRDMYPNVPSFYMKWNRRKEVICDELIGWNPDIICLQEVDKYFDLLNIMEKEGYAGSYKRRTGDAVDGCAMFWKANKFRLLEEESIEFKGFGLRDNVAQLSVFEADV